MGFKSKPMFCKACGEPVPADSAFCNRCGARISTPGVGLPRKPTPPRTGAGYVGWSVGRMLRAAVRSGPKAWLGILALVAVLIWLIHLNGGRQEQPAAQDLTKATTDNSPKDLPGWENTRWSMTEKQVRAAVTSPLDVPRSKAEQPSGNKWYMPFLIRNAEVEGFHCEARFFFDKRSKALDTVYLQLRENSDTPSTEAAQQKAIFERMVATVTKRYGKYTAKKDRSSSGVHNEETIWTFPSSVLAVQYHPSSGAQRRPWLLTRPFPPRLRTAKLQCAEGLRSLSTGATRRRAADILALPAEIVLGLAKFFRYIPEQPRPKPDS